MNFDFLFLPAIHVTNVTSTIRISKLIRLTIWISGVGWITYTNFHKLIVIICQCITLRIFTFLITKKGCYSSRNISISEKTVTNTRDTIIKTWLSRLFWLLFQYPVSKIGMSTHENPKSRNLKFIRYVYVPLINIGTLMKYT